MGMCLLCVSTQSQFGPRNTPLSCCPFMFVSSFRSFVDNHVVPPPPLPPPFRTTPHPRTNLPRPSPALTALNWPLTSVPPNPPTASSRQIITTIVYTYRDVFESFVLRLCQVNRESVCYPILFDYKAEERVYVRLGAVDTINVLKHSSNSWSS